ncbi:hypothetical protein DSECCO2_398990 [anaerobic digester metagenome]
MENAACDASTILERMKESGDGFSEIAGKVQQNFNETMERARAKAVIKYSMGIDDDSIEDNQGGTKNTTSNSLDFTDIIEYLIRLTDLLREGTERKYFNVGEPFFISMNDLLVKLIKLNCANSILVERLSKVVK